MNESTDDKIDRLEWKINLLLAFAAIQLVRMVLGWIGAIFGSTFWVLVVLAALGGLLYAFRDQLPSLSGQLIRYVFSKQGNGNQSDSTIV